MNRLIQLALMLLVSTLALGCGGNGKAMEPTPGGVPRPFTIEFRSFESGRRSVFYQLGEDGSLRYGGGRDAQGRSAPRSAGMLDEADCTLLWEIIRRHNLLDAEGELFPDAERVRYEVKLRVGRRRHGFSAADEKVSGLKELDEALFKLQSRNRFEEQTEGIVPKD